MKTFLRAKWQNLIMANYEVDPAILIPYLPKGTELDYYEGKTYVSLVGFLFKDTSIFGIPIPFLGTFEEINLRFYVVSKEGNEVKRGVVFINETVPNKLVACIANKLYKEHYTAVPTKHSWGDEGQIKSIQYQWKKNDKWNQLAVKANLESIEMKSNSIEEFIFEHYYGYTRVNENKTLEYSVHHPSWRVYPILDYTIDCDFKAMYGSEFSHLKDLKPHSIMIAEGSEISVDWKRNPL